MPKILNSNVICILKKYQDFSRTLSLSRVSRFSRVQGNSEMGFRVFHVQIFDSHSIVPSCISL